MCLSIYPMSIHDHDEVPTGCFLEGWCVACIQNKSGSRSNYGNNTENQRAVQAALAKKEMQGRSGGIDSLMGGPGQGKTGEGMGKGKDKGKDKGKGKIGGSGPHYRAPPDANVAAGKDKNGKGKVTQAPGPRYTKPVTKRPLKDRS